MTFSLLRNMTNKIPSYDELPIDPKYPPHTAWSVWGEDDNLGTLNFLTEERVAQVSIHMNGILVPIAEQITLKYRLCI